MVGLGRIKFAVGTKDITREDKGNKDIYQANGFLYG
jgi:hypothetical protein